MPVSNIFKASTFVPPEGDPETAKLVIVGEQPGKTEVKYRRPFAGAAGDVLNSCLNMAQIERGSCYITNVIKDLDHPLSHYVIQKGEKIVGFTSAGETYVGLLKAELESTRANVICPLGNVALLALYGVSGITRWRGSILSSTLLPGRKIIPSVHPATVIPPKMVYTNKLLIINDLERALAQSAYPELPRLELDLVIEPSLDDVLTFLAWIKDFAISQNRVVDFDIEVNMQTLELTCLALSVKGKRAICIPFTNSNGDYFTIEQEIQVMLRVADILEDPRITIGGQNVIFDSHFMLNKYGIVVNPIPHCTMIAQRILMPDFPVGLHFIQSIYTELPYHKEDGKKHIKLGSGNWQKFWTYNCLDTISTGQSRPKQLVDLERQGNLTTYERQRRLIPPLTYMMERGIRVDVEGMLAHRERNEQQISKLYGQLCIMTSVKDNLISTFVNSPAQLKEYFYTKRGIKPYHSKKDRTKITVDDDALKKMARIGVKEAQIIRDIRKYSNENSRYLNPYEMIDGLRVQRKVDADGRIRCQYNPAGTETGRLSSSENIFGTGMNMQNWPHNLLRYLLADEGYIYYAFDMSQIENRIVAYVGRVIEMIEAFESGKDLHRLTASLIFHKPYDEVSDEPGSCKIAGGVYSERFWGKKANHGLNYDLGVNTFSEYYELPVRDAKFIVDSYHRAYPGVRGNYHTLVRSMILNDRTVTNCFGRRRQFLGKLEDKLYKEAYAQIPQSTSSDKVNEQGVQFIYYDQEQFGPIELLTQVHDSVGFQIPLAIGWPEHARMLATIKRSLETPITWNDRQFVVPADLSIGLNLNKEEGIEIKAKAFPSDEGKLADMLRDSYEKLVAKKES